MEKRLLSGGRGCGEQVEGRGGLGQSLGGEGREVGEEGGLAWGRAVEVGREGPI